MPIGIRGHLQGENILLYNLFSPVQRRSQVSLAGGADRIPGGDKPQYL